MAAYQPHFNQPIKDGECERVKEKYDDSVLCRIPLRSVRFASMENKDLFVGQKLRVFNVNDGE